MARVLVTRPEPAASATSRRLSALGHRPLVLPLSRVEVLSPALPEADSVDAVAITSANALRFASQGLPSALLGKSCYAVGARSAEVARSAGFAAPFAAEGDGTSLAQMIVGREAPGTRVLYLCGRVRRPEFERILAAAGLACRAVETYDNVFSAPSAAEVAVALEDAPADFALVYSPRSAAALAPIATGGAAARYFAATTFLCLSRSVADALVGVESRRKRWSVAPEEDALLRLLDPA